MKCREWYACLLFVPLVAAPAAAQRRITKFTGEDAYDRAGSAVALDGSTAVVGAERAHGSSTSGDGAAYVLRRGPSGWPSSTGSPDCIELSPPASAYTETFGAAVALQGATIVVGEPEFQHDLVTYDYGAAFVYRDLGAAVVLEGLLMPAPIQEGYAGSSVAVAGDVAVVGAPGAFGSSTDPGRVYVYRRSAALPHWGAFESVLVAPAAAPGQRFGYSVAFDGLTLLVGEPGASLAHAFRHDGLAWAYDGALAPLAAASGLGNSLAVSGDTAVVGASSADAALVFRRVAPGVWQQVERFEGLDPARLEAFGAAVAIDADRIAVSASNDDVVHVFRRTASNAWRIAQRIDELHTDLMGVSVALSGEELLVGALLDDDAGVDAGAAVFFESPRFVDQLGFGALGACPCSNDDPYAGCANSTGRGAVLRVEGSASLAAGDMLLRTTRLPAHRTCLTVMGDASFSAPLGAGLRAVKPGVEGLARLAPSALSSSFGEFVDGPALGALHPSFAALASPGENWFFQTWYRDPAFSGCAAAANLSNAVRVTFAP